MRPNYPLTLLYDASCPICALEMDHLRARSSGGEGDDPLRFVDIDAPGFDPARYGVTLAALDAEIHGVRPDGSVVRGVEALRLAYDAARLGWVLRPTAWPAVRPLCDAGYRVFARHRTEISRAAAPLIGAIRAQRARYAATRMKQCAGGACRVGQGSSAGSVS